ncbi:uncharacterized protein [Macrobrachium rosenbergii]|uniref:uncharacterized protein n=1 Tax=Macrobrachium rosenbergii TaxID=79674 RepID=UPI0034D569B2
MSGSPADRLPGPICFSEAGNIAEHWRLFIQEFEIYLISTEQDTKSDKIKLNLFLRCAGRDALKLYNSFTYAANEDPNSYETVVAKFNKYFEQGRSELTERYVFNNRVQRAGETIDAFAADLMNKAQSCGFGEETEAMVMMAIVKGLSSSTFREKLSEVENLTLDKVIKLGRIHEIVMQEHPSSEEDEDIAMCWKRL